MGKSRYWKNLPQIKDYCDGTTLNAKHFQQVTTYLEGETVKRKKILELMKKMNSLDWGNGKDTFYVVNCTEVWDYLMSIEKYVKLIKNKRIENFMELYSRAQDYWLDSGVSHY